jgi:phage terminase large subunit-like protein
MAISRDKFQYYDKKWLQRENGKWYYKDRRLNLVASIDFAASINKRSDYTVIVVIGIDRDNNIYVLEVDRFKTDRISESFQHILDTYKRWDYNRLIAETSVAQNVIVQELRNQYIKPMGLYLSITETKPNRHQGTKEERMAMILEPRYDNQAVWHYQGGNCQILEEELVQRHPPHDDCKDALATAIQFAVPPAGLAERSSSRSQPLTYNSRFGGIAG